MINFLQVPPVEPQPGFMQQYSFIIMIGLMVLVLWLFMWRPEAKRRKQMQAFRDGLKKGDKVYVGSGLVGTLSKVEDEKFVMAEIAKDVHVKVLRAAITGLVTEDKATEKKD